MVEGGGMLIPRLRVTPKLGLRHRLRLRLLTLRLRLRLRLGW